MRKSTIFEPPSKLYEFPLDGKQLLISRHAHRSKPDLGHEFSLAIRRNATSLLKHFLAYRGLPSVQLTSGIEGQPLGPTSGHSYV